MLLNSLAFAFRKLARNKTITAINVMGLTIGISTCLVIFSVVSFELSFDKFHPDSNRIYRIYSQMENFGIFNGAPTALKQGIKNELTSVQSITNFFTWSEEVKIPKTSGQINFGLNEKIVIVEPDYFDVFTHYEWIKGDPSTSLKNPFTVVLTESKARQYFGIANVSDVVGREIIYKDSLLLTVSGVVKDIPFRTDLDFTDFISFETINSSWLKKSFQLDAKNSVNSNSQLFLKLSESSSKEALETQINDKAHFGKGYSYTFLLQPLSDLHFNPSIDIFDNHRSTANIKILTTLSGIAIAIFLLAAINFINLSTAQSSIRAKEVGIRKTMGVSRKALIFHFLMESFLMTAGAIATSLFVSGWMVKALPQYFPPDFHLILSEPSILLFIGSCLVFVTLFAGLYPAFVLSSHRPAIALRSTTTVKSNPAIVRKSLTVVQLVISQILIVVTVVMSLQVDFIMKKDWGFSREGIIKISTPWWDPDNVAKEIEFSNEVKEFPEISSISVAGAPLGNSARASTSLEGEKTSITAKRMYVDTAFFRLYKISIVAGRNLIHNDSLFEYLINETCAHQLGYNNVEEILGKKMDRKYEIVGIVKDFNTKSLHSNIEPVVIRSSKISPTITLKIFDSNLIDQTAKKLESSWRNVYGQAPFRYELVEDEIARLHESDFRSRQLSQLATIISIFISCCGLFGLIAFSVNQRTKEIGIRKVFGASVPETVFLLVKDLAVLLGIGIIVSIPVGYYFVQDWLNPFAFRIPITPWIFLISGFISVITAMLSVSFRTIKAAKLDPVKTLRYE